MQDFMQFVYLFLYGILCKLYANEKVFPKTDKVMCRIDKKK